MFDVGWSELLVIGVIVLFAFGPEDIPKIMYNLGRVMRRLRYMRFALSSQFDDFMEKAEAQGRTQAQKAAEQSADPNAPKPRESEADDDEILMGMLPMPPAHTETLPPIDHDRPDAVPTRADANAPGPAKQRD